MKRFAILAVLAAAVCLGFLTAPASACGLSAAFVGQAAYCPAPVALALPQVQYAPLQLPQMEALPAAPCPSVGLSVQSYAPQVQFAAVQSYAQPAFGFAAQTYGVQSGIGLNLAVARRGFRRGIGLGIRGRRGLGLGLGLGLGVAPALAVDPLTGLPVEVVNPLGLGFGRGSIGGRRRR